MQNDRAHQVADCGQPGNLSNDFPLGSRKFLCELVYFLRIFLLDRYRVFKRGE